MWAKIQVQIQTFNLNSFESKCSLFQLLLSLKFSDLSVAFFNPYILQNVQFTNMCIILICLYIVAVWCLQISLMHISYCIKCYYALFMWPITFRIFKMIVPIAIWTVWDICKCNIHLAYTLCILWDCCTNCNQLGSVWSQSLLLKHCQHIAHIFQANVLPMFRMQYFCNNVIFATPICNTFLSNKDIWSRIRFEIFVVQVLTSQGSCASMPFFFNIRPGLDISESFLHWKISGNVKMIDSMFITSLNHGGKWGTSVLLLLNVLRF